MTVMKFNTEMYGLVRCNRCNNLVLVSRNGLLADPQDAPCTACGVGPDEVLLATFDNSDGEEVTAVVDKRWLRKEDVDKAEEILEEVLRAAEVGEMLLNTPGMMRKDGTVDLDLYAAVMRREFPGEDLQQTIGPAVAFNSVMNDEELTPEGLEYQVLAITDRAVN